ncbi:hypothetical protein L3049_14070 [Labilibaculum sp. DW002]|uniref:Polyvalent protein metallopeptidase domain-containing protein n=1 Tax=Paralabilibaculum antarcticum TaxID=2912572 RepID=A0ABT5VUM5_9BACT|nr:zincin-like metallopeptidase domain-containing protein [Labilibaculum sp. DW002]MDE5419122.1 hypothetical protein [Labilibaculum sp. DW002]
MLGLFEEEVKARQSKKPSLTCILKGIFDQSIDGWKDDKEKFKLELLNDIKTFLFTKWEKPWKPSLLFDEKGNVLSGFRNINGRVYKNLTNVISLAAKSENSPFFITVKKLASLGGEIIDASKKVSVVSYIPMWKDPENKTPRKPDYVLPKVHKAINIEYVKGIKKPVVKTQVFEKLELNEYVENFIKELKKRKRIPKLIYDQADSCHYAHSLGYGSESIHMVKIDTFKKIEFYYSVLFHEITHSTMNPKRLGREKLDRPTEELVAEMGALIICEELGLQYTKDNSLSYLNSWMKQAKNLDESLLKAYSLASEAAEYLLEDIDFESLVPQSMQKRAEDKKEVKEPGIKERIQKRAKQLEEKPKKVKPEEKPEEKPEANWFIPRTLRTELDYDLAYRAYTGTSFSPEKRAVSEQNSYANSLNEFAKEIEEIAKSDQQKELALSEFATYKERFLKKKTALLVAKSRCMSTMITGGSNFPVRSNQKKLDTEHRRLEEYLEFIEKAQKGILRKIKKAIPKEQAEKEAFEKIENQTVQYIAAMISIHKGESVGSINHYRALLKGFIERLSKNHQHQHVNKVFQIIRDSQKKFDLVIFTEKNKVWSLENLTDGAIVKETGERVLMENKDAKLVNNLDAERVQIITDEKPSEEIRSVLKRNAFRYSPRFTAWQRKNTRQGIYIAEKVFQECFPDQKKEKKQATEKPEQLTLLGHNDKSTVKLTDWKPSTEIIPLKGQLGQLLGGYERNQFAVVLRGEKGAGKTRLLCQMINLFALEKLNGLFLSLEVSPESELFGNYISYISKSARKHVAVSSSNTIEELEEYCKKYDFIAIDSWGKLKDVAQEDFMRLIEKYPNVIWLCIFQSTTAGTARGGIMSEYDSSMVIQVVRGGNAQCEKNRYNSCDLVYNVFDKKIIKDEN